MSGLVPELARAVARLNSIDDVMERLRIGRSKVYMEMDAGRLRSCKVGSRRMVFRGPRSSSTSTSSKPALSKCPKQTVEQRF